MWEAWQWLINCRNKCARTINDIVILSFSCCSFTMVLWLCVSPSLSQCLHENLLTCLPKQHQRWREKNRLDKTRSLQQQEQSGLSSSASQTKALFQERCRAPLSVSLVPFSAGREQKASQQQTKGCRPLPKPRVSFQSAALLRWRIWRCTRHPFPGDLLGFN